MADGCWGEEGVGARGVGPGGHWVAGGWDWVEGCLRAWGQGRKALKLWGVVHDTIPEHGERRF